MRDRSNSKELPDSELLEDWVDSMVIEREKVEVYKEWHISLVTEKDR